MYLTHEMLEQAAEIGGRVVLCRGVLDGLRRELGDRPFTAREAIEALPVAGGWWSEGARGLRALQLAGIVPADTGWVWAIARQTLLDLPAPLNVWAERLGPDNWEEALADITEFSSGAADAVYYAHRAAHDNRADQAAYFAFRAAAVAVDAKDKIINIVCAVVDNASESWAA